jgi:hypothetical protein
MFKHAQTFHVFAMFLKAGSRFGGLIVIGFLVALFIVLALLAKKRAKTRTTRISEIARQMGWTFRESAPLSLIPTPERFSVFSQKHTTGKGLRNVMSAKIHDADALGFEYAYSIQTLGSGGTPQTTTTTQTVAYFSSPHLNLPEFLLRPKGATHKLAAALGSKDIAFDSHPTFSEKFLLRGPDEQSVRSVFRPEVLAFFEDNLNLSVEGSGNELLVYRLNKAVKPEELNEFLNQAKTLLNIFQQSKSAPGNAVRSGELRAAANA